MTFAPVHLTRAGVSLVLAPAPSGSPAILHWGEALGDLSPAALDGLVALHRPGVPHSAMDQPRLRGVVGETGSGFTGLPGLEGVRAGRTAGSWEPRLRDWTCTGTDDLDAGARLEGADPEAGWGVVVDLELTREGLVRQRLVVTNTGPGDLQLQAVRAALPVPARAAELLDLTGRWCRERTPQRRDWLLGAHVREGRHGRTGHDATLLMAAGRPGFGFGHGEVWSVHVAWSGDHTTYAERTAEGECLLGGGELLGPGEVVLAEGESYTSPWLLGSYAGDGLDAVSARLHGWTRRHAPRTRSTRPVLLNSWEAAYFDHDLDRLGELARAAAEVGVERFVLDDGWFRGRRHDRAGLGDWTVDPAVWPEGLHPLDRRDQAARHGLRALGGAGDGQRGLRPRAGSTPTGCCGDARRCRPSGGTSRCSTSRCPRPTPHVRDALLSLLGEYDIAFLKWDHNRDVFDAAHAGRPAVHGQTLAFYRLLDELRDAHPRLEIESCASGGGRIDLEVLTRTDRVWPSDTIDAVERQRIQRWTSLVVPPEMLGAHLGGPVAHTTGRTHRLELRAATAMLGHFGIEWDLRTLAPDARAEVAAWVALHKRIRPVLSTGRLVRGDHPDPGLVVSGAVADDAAEAWYVVATVDTLVTQSPTAVQLPGLDPARTYRVTGENPPGERQVADLGESWLDGDGLEVPGSVLGSAGVRLPVTAPESAYVLRAVAVS